MGSFSERLEEANGMSWGSAHGLSDASLVEAAKGGQSMAFDTLSERYRQQLLRAARRITRSLEDAEDAVQDTFLRAFVHVRDFDGRSSFGTWLTRIAINSALMNLRKKRASREIATEYNDENGADGLRYEITDRGPNPERRYAQREEERMLKKAIQGLRPGLRVAVQIQQLQECSLQETAEAIGISVAATKGRLFHARKALRRSVIPKLKNQPRVDSRTRVLTGWEVARAERRNEYASPMNTVQPQGKGRKEKGDEYVSNSKETTKHRASTRVHPSGDGGGFGCEPVA